jgi:hypothetical protein
MGRPSPGWAVELTGPETDLNDFRDELKVPFNPWSEDYSTNDGRKLFLLRSKNWAKLAEPADVRRDARRILELLNGAAVLIHSDAQIIELGATMRFREDGTREPTLFAIAARMAVTLGSVRLRATASTGSEPLPPQESNMQRWCREAEASDVKAELLLHLDRLHQSSNLENWFDLYKVTELLEDIGGGALSSALILLNKKRRWDATTRTANVYRHAPGRMDLPSRPPRYDEARDLVIQVASAALALKTVASDS